MSVNLSDLRRKEGGPVGKIIAELERGAELLDEEYGGVFTPEIKTSIVDAGRGRRPLIVITVTYSSPDVEDPLYDPNVTLVRGYRRLMT